MSKYIGLTIGPISKTIYKARSTGELWGSSYLFSYVMKKIISKLIGYGQTVEIISPDKFIVPHVLNKNNEAIDINLFKNAKAGLFHDRLIFQSAKGDFEKLEKVVDEVKSELAENIYKEIDDDKLDKNDVKAYVDGYLKIYFVEVDVNGDKSIIESVSEYLDLIELREKFLDEEEIDYIFKMFGTDNKKNNVKNTFLTNDAFEEKRDIKSLYPSIIRIASKELKIPEDNEYNNDMKLIEYLKKNGYKNRLKKYHQYVALVQVDGDSMGKVIRELKSNNECKKFSKQLLEYSKNAVKIINEYGGFPIYAGGDDLLFFAPIKNSTSKLKCKNIFELFRELDSIFSVKFKDYQCANPSISIGMEVFHQKYPLYTAIPETATLLFEKAKGFKYEYDGKKYEKNAIAFKLVKSSGENFSAVLRKDGQTYIKFIELFNKISSNSNNQEVKDTLNQIHIKFLRDKNILNKIGDDEIKLKNYFDNNFNESVHQSPEILDFISNIKEFILVMYKEYGCLHDIAINNIYACLKFIRFMNEESDLLEKEVNKNE